MENAGMARVALLINPFEFHIGRPVVMGAEIRTCDCRGTRGTPRWLFDNARVIECDPAFANKALYRAHRNTKYY